MTDDELITALANAATGYAMFEKGKPLFEIPRYRAADAVLALLVPTSKDEI